MHLNLLRYARMLNKNTTNFSIIVTYDYVPEKYLIILK